jgi:UMF1 family MFS transporter
LVEVGRLASRWSIGSVLVLFVAGAAVLWRVDEEKGKLEVARVEGGPISKPESGQEIAEVDS